MLPHESNCLRSKDPTERHKRRRRRRNARRTRHVVVLSSVFCVAASSCLSTSATVQAFSVSQSSSVSSRAACARRHMAAASSTRSTSTAATTPAASQQEQRQQSPSTDSSSAPTTASTTTTIDTYGMTPSQMERAIVQAGRRGHTDEALRIYQQLPRPTVRQVNAAVDACARARPVRLEQAFALLETSPVPPNVYTFGSLMHACARAADVTRAVQVLRDMPRVHGVTPNAVVYHAAVSAAARAADVDTAWRLLDEARSRHGLALSVVGYNAALHAAAKAGRIDQAVALVQRMEAAAAAAPSNDKDSEDDEKYPLVPAPDAVTYATLLSAFEQAQDWESLMTYADRMQAAGHALDGLAITSVLHACQQLGRPRDALAYFRRMKDTASYPRHTAGRYTADHRPPVQGPDAVAFVLTISACGRGGAWRDGVRLLNEYQISGSDNEDDTAVFTAAVRGCELAGAYTAALQLVHRMRRSGVAPNEMTWAAVLGACATACAQAGAAAAEDDAVENDDTDPDARQAPFQTAMRLWRVLQKDSAKTTVNIQMVNAAVRVCAEALQLDQAFALVDDLTKATSGEKANGEDGSDRSPLQPNIVTYGTLMAACERVGNLERVNQVFTRMRQDGLEPNEVIYGAAISTCRKAGDPERALLLLRKMLRDELKPNVVTFNTVLACQTEVRGRGSQELERALLVFQLLCSEQYSSATPNRQTYNLMVRFLAECQRPREAEVLLRQMRQKHGHVPDVHLYTAVVAAYERNGQPLKALRLMESMNADGYDFYEAKVLNAAFKRALKVANVLNKGFSGVRSEESLDGNEFGQDEESNVWDASSSSLASSLKSRLDTDSFIKGKRLSDDEDGLQKKGGLLP